MKFVTVILILYCCVVLFVYMWLSFIDRFSLKVYIGGRPWGSAGSTGYVHKLVRVKRQELCLYSY